MPASPQFRFTASVTLGVQEGPKYRNIQGGIYLSAESTEALEEKIQNLKRKYEQLATSRPDYLLKMGKTEESALQG